MRQATSLGELLEFFEGGAFPERVAKAIADTALLTVANDGKRAKGKVTLQLDFKRIADSSQVAILATIEYAAPTSRGGKSEFYETEVPVHVVSGGKLTMFPEASPMFPGNNPARQE
jgi:hypothetical protein